MQSRRLSSRLTDLYRYGVPGFFSLWLLLALGLLMPRAGETVDWELLSLLALIVGGLGWAYYLVIGRVKHVEIEDDRLIVRGLRQTVQIPLSDVVSVDGSLFVNPEQIWLDLRRPCEFGSRIHFLPPMRLFHIFTHHPMVGELRELIAAGWETGSPLNASSDTGQASRAMCLVLAAVAVFALLLVGFAMGVLRSSDPYVAAIEALHADPRVADRLGDPIEPGWWVLGSLRRSGTGGRANLRFALRGSLEDAGVSVSARRIEGRWRLDDVSVRGGVPPWRIEVAQGPGHR